MYTTRLICIFISTMLFSSTGCEKSQFSIYDAYSGQATATVNGSSEWEARTLVSETRIDQYIGTYSIRIDVHSGNGFLRESLTAILVNPYPDTIIPFDPKPVVAGDTLLANVSYATSQDDGDVHCALYTVDSTFDNYFIVDEFNKSSYAVSGRFSMRYINDDFTLCELPFPDTITFTDGQFTTTELYRGE